MIRSSKRLLSLVLLTSLAVVPACDKGGGSDAPGGGGGSDDAKGEDPGFAYSSEAFKLRETLDLKITVSGSGAGTMNVAMVGTVDAAPHADKMLRVHSVVEEITNLELTGDMKPEPKEGEEPKTMEQLIEELKGDDNLAVCDLIGDVDADATRALPENKAEEDKAKAEADAAKESGDEPPRPNMSVANYLSLPDLPKVPLKEGETTTLEKQADERDLFGAVKIPVESDYKYTYQGVQTVDGRQVATFDIFVEGGGATDIEGQQGSAFVSILEETDVTVKFDLDNKVPVSVEGYQAFEIEFEAQGQQQRVEYNSDISATYAKI